MNIYTCIKIYIHTHIYIYIHTYVYLLQIYLVNTYQVIIYVVSIGGEDTFAECCGPPTPPPRRWRLPEVVLCSYCEGPRRDQ